MMGAIGDFLFRHRNALFPFACLFIFLPSPTVFGEPLVAALAGVVLASVGQLVRVLTIGMRYIIRGGRDGRVYAEGLVTDGVYSLCRNPMYVGNILIGIGVALASNSLLALAITVLLIVFAYIAIVVAEERYLLGKFGAAFQAYCDATPRWLPRAGELGRLSMESFHWRRVIIKEYGTPFGWVNAVCLITLYNLWRADALQPAAVGLIASMTAVTCFWLAARVLKKTRRLVAD
jgi:protein-S-isoprenylcysteine O-methyltransferase Ste14